MSEDSPLAFVSYSHDDNKNAQGKIKFLADALKSEYELMSGESLEVFIDDRSIEWGQEWRSRIDGALTRTTFFIPFITPRYFKRDECRREFVEFSSQARSLGLEDLLLPILYVDVPGLNSDSKDEVIARVAQLQHADWRKLRLADISSSEYRIAVNSLAKRLNEASIRVADSQVARELSATADDDGDLGIADIIEKIDELLPSWLEGVLSNRTTRAQIVASINEHLKRFRRLERSRSSRSALMSTQLRLGTTLLPLIERARSEAYDYLKASIELDPWMIMANRALQQHPENRPLFNHVLEAISEAVDVIAEMKRTAQHLHENGDAHSIFDHVLEVEHLSRTLSRVCAIDRDHGKAIVGGNDIVARWWRDLTSPTREVSGQG